MIASKYEAVAHTTVNDLIVYNFSKCTRMASIVHP